MAHKGVFYGSSDQDKNLNKGDQLDLSEAEQLQTEDRLTCLSLEKKMSNFTGRCLGVSKIFLRNAAKAIWYIFCER